MVLHDAIVKGRKPTFLFLLEEFLLPCCVSLPCASFTAHTKQNSDHQTRDAFSRHQAILCDTTWASYSSTQFWGHLPRESVSSHRLKAQSFRTAPAPQTHFRHQSPLQAATCASDQPAADVTFQQPPAWVQLTCWSRSQDSGKHLHVPVY